MAKQPLSVIESSVLELIPVGSERKTSLSEIERLIDIDKRSIQSVLLSLVKKGIPIVSVRGLVEGGLFIATTDEEREIGLRSYESQANEMFVRIKLIREADLNHWHEDIVTTTQERLGV